MLAPADRSMLAYVEKLTRSPMDIGEADVVVLREAGFDDRSIHDIAAVAAYLAFVTRLSLGLGVDIHDFAEGDRHWLEKKD
ncbi:MAG TPA: hypothetical protein VM778_09875 [Gemmatimonadota bacterium]|nr:hypothetical protein [Gemmatimonadota bacterium]